MKKLFLVFITWLFIINAASAQTSTLNISLVNSTAASCNIWIPDLALSFDYLKKGALNIQLTSGSGSHQFKLEKPQFIYLIYSSSDADTAKVHNYVFYLSPGDNISFKADFKSKSNAITVTGKGSVNNQPLLGALAGARVDSLYGDTLPNRIIAFSNKHKLELKTALDKYKLLYKPGADFIKAEEFNVRYDAVQQYYEFKEGNKFNVKQDAYARNLDEWNKIQDSLFATVKLNNNSALNALNYILLIKNFLVREKEGLWQESHKNPEFFFKEWYNTDAVNGKKEFDDDPENLLQEKIINRYFTGQSAEFLYANLFDDALGEHDPKNVVTIFDRFKKNYPNSKYISWFGPAIDTIRIKETQPLTADMIFAPDNGSKLFTLNDLLALTKGKTVLLDMWGTWCGPCRNEIHDNGPEIKAYFKGKALDYFYVANRDTANVEEWKKLIAYLNMTGTHILANACLTKDIMSKVKGTGYPTYVIIKKDGSYELSKAGYPMNREILIKQIEAALAQ